MKNESWLPTRWSESRTNEPLRGFQRTMTVPFDPDPSKVAANLKDGVLMLTLPKPPEVQRQTKKIEIKN